MEVIRSLISSGALSDRALYVCEKRAEHAEKNLLENKKINGMKHLFSDVYKLIYHGISLASEHNYRFSGGYL